MRTLSAKSKKVLDFFRLHPEAKPSAVARKFNMHIQYVYKLRKRADEEFVETREAEPAPNVDHRDFTITLHSSDKGTIAVSDVLDSRAVDYGAFRDGAALMQGMKRLLADHAQKHNKTFADDQWEALEMIVHKVGRIVNGNPDKVDHWTDIAGYATLVADRLGGKVR